MCLPYYVQYVDRWEQRGRCSSLDRAHRNETVLPRNVLLNIIRRTRLGMSGEGSVRYVIGSGDERLCSPHTV